MVRRVTAAVLSASLLAATAACSFTTNSYNCNNDQCSVSSKGSGSTTQLYDSLDVTLNGSDGKTADLELDGEKVSCSEGDTKQVESVTVTCDKVGDDEVDLTVKG